MCARINRYTKILQSGWVSERFDEILDHILNESVNKIIDRKIRSRVSSYLT